MGFGCVVGVILGLLPVILLVVGALIIQDGQAEISRALGPLGSILAPRMNISWNAIGLIGLVVVVASGMFYAIGGWLAALGFNLVAHMTGGLALDLTSDGTLLPTQTGGAVPYSAPAQKDPTMPLPRSLQTGAPAAPFPVISSGAAAIGVQPSTQPGSGGAPAASASAPVASSGVHPLLVSESDATALWSLKTGTTTIGSDPSNDVVLLGDSTVAPKHAEVRAESSGYVVYDLGTPAGTFVNGRRVQGRNLLKDGFRIKLGSTLLLFRDTR